MIKTLKQTLTVIYEVKYDDTNNWIPVDEQYNIDESEMPTSSYTVASQLLNSIVKQHSYFVAGNLEMVSNCSEELGSFEETIVDEVKEFLNLDSDGDMSNEYTALVQDVSINISESEIIEDA